MYHAHHMMNLKSARSAKSARDKHTLTRLIFLADSTDDADIYHANHMMNLKSAKSAKSARDKHTLTRLIFLADSTDDADMYRTNHMKIENLRDQRNLRETNKHSHEQYFSQIPQMTQICTCVPYDEFKICEICEICERQTNTHMNNISRRYHR